MTSVNTKPTIIGYCSNFNSLCPDRYKSGVIKSFLNKCYTISHSWFAFHKEVKRTKQLLTNNDYPLAYIEKGVKKFLEQKCLQAKHSMTF